MESDWSEAQQILIPPNIIQSEPAPASAIAFDTRQDLLWTGNEWGRVTAFYSIQLTPYTSYRAHPRDGGPVKQILFHDKGVLSVAPTSVHFSLRRGLTQWHIEDPLIKDLRCMSFLGKEQAKIIAAGCQDTMLMIDIDKGQIIAEVPTEYHYTMMKCSHYICAATNTGSVNILDADNLNIVKTLTTNYTGINDMDARNNYLVTCGWTTRQGTPSLAGLANVYDLRAMVQLAPIPFHAGAANIQIHPRMSTTCIIASQHGQLQVVDIVNPNNVHLRQADLPNCLSLLVLAPSGDALVLSDQDGVIHLWGSPSKIKFTEYSESAEMPDRPPQLEWMDVDTDLPFHKVGMPFYREQLLSAWSNSQFYDVGRPLLKVDPDILDKLQPFDVGKWAPNPGRVRRNQAEHTKPTTEAQGNVFAAPKFLSEKARDAEPEPSGERRISEISEAMANAALDSAKADIPIMYQKVEIKYSKFGVDDFDFEYYNRTGFSGLETHINNSYTNSLLQLLRFTPVVRNLALKHTATNCISESCLLCELGFLFDMLEKAEGANCQATNFLKAFTTIAERRNSEMLEEKSRSSSLALMIQIACKVLFENISTDLHTRSYPQVTEFDHAFAIRGFTSMKCLQCRNETVRRSTAYISELSYSSPDPHNRGRPRILTFSEIFNESVLREKEGQTRGWCIVCQRYPLLQSHLSVRAAPDVLMINTAVRSPEAKQYWSLPGWLPQRIGVIIENGRFYCFEGEALDGHLDRRLHFVKLYDLVGVVTDVGSGGEHQKPHLVSLINVALSQKQPGEPENWHLFNDFLVRKVGTDDALKFPSAWKTPSIVTYQVSTAHHTVDDSWKVNLDTTLLYHDWSSNNRPSRNCRVLRALDEAPYPGSPVAIDTEFVILKEEEIDIRADGERVVVRPARLGLARVSVLRGEGIDKGLPFINDYLEVNEPVINYLTQYSGVRAGDLSKHTSAFNLVPLKIAYKKLWLLLNLGCVFIGHGLLKDFRTINIRIPKSQVVDTVDLFYIKARQRKLSLRFLAWYLLKEEIQTDEHDSIEDARSALKLWHKWEELKEKGIEVDAVEEVYREGKKWGFRPPGEGQVARKGLGSSADLGGSSLTVPGVVGGRETPDIMRGGSGPGTPLGKGIGRGALGGVDSPLR